MKPIISIVSGTYNRLPHLKNMVASARQSIGRGIPYEIVLVDGGSTDGTIEWCKSQSDIVLIEQGELLGAVKAFNAGCYVARGDYVVIANDDITFVDETLIQALAYMQDHPDVGVGCFYQDRGGRDWHVEYMPAIINNKQMMHVYGQVCIVPKWLGDKVGWWGDYLHTYGGDNELSANVLEFGYRVEPISCCCIHDLVVEDELREINMREHDIISKKVAKHYKKRSRHHPNKTHPDTTTWGNKWTKGRMCGPVVSFNPKEKNPLQRKIRFLYVPIYEVGHPHQKQTKRGLRDALARLGMVYEYDYLGVAAERGNEYMLAYLRDIADSWNPDVILMQVHTPTDTGINARYIHLLKKEHPQAKLVNWNGDYHPRDLLSPQNVAMAKAFDLQCVVTTVVSERYDAAGVNWMYWQIGYEKSDARPDASTPQHDVVFLANGYSGDRLKLGKALRKLKGVDVGLYGSWGKGIRANGNTLYDFDAGCKLYRAAKLAIGDSQWPDATGFVSNRLFQAMAAGGSLLLHQWFDGMSSLLGLEDGVHLIVWDDIRDLKKKIQYWLRPVNAAKRQEIAAAGRDFVLKHHSFDVRVAELMKELGM